MWLVIGEFICWFLIYVLFDGFYCICYYGFLVSVGCKINIVKICVLFGVEIVKQDQFLSVEIVLFMLRELCFDCGG